MKISWKTVGLGIASFAVLGVSSLISDAQQKEEIRKAVDEALKKKDEPVSNGTQQ